MKDILLGHLKKYTNIPDESLMEVIEQIPIQVFKQGTVLIEQGEIASECYFVLKGLIRQYFIDTDGIENTVNFFTENQVAAVYNSKEAARYFLACLEDSVLLVGDLNNETQMCEKYPFLEELIKNMLEETMAVTQDEYADFLSSNPEERYLALLKKRPGLAGRVLQSQLASYLGIQPESLSRIKRRLNTLE